MANIIDSPDLQVHDDLPPIHIFCINLDSIDPERLENNKSNHYGNNNTPAD